MKSTVAVSSAILTFCLAMIVRDKGEENLNEKKRNFVMRETKRGGLLL